MATKPSDLLNAIPSVSDLLDKPPIRGLSDRLNRSVVAAGVRSFLDELRSDVQRRAAEVQLPSIRELAERAARHVITLQQQSQRPAINATGRIQGPPWISAPLADGALERMFALGRDFSVGPPHQTGPQIATSSDVGPMVCRLTQAQATTAVHSYAGAVWLTLAALSHEQEVLVCSAEMGDVDSGRPLPQLVTSAGAILKAVGTTNRTLAADYEAAVSPQTAAILKLSPDSYRIVGETETPELDELVGLARDRELALVAGLGAAPLLDLPPSLRLDRSSVRANIAAGIDLVVVRGDGLVGGPQCGIIAGNRELVARITDHPLFTAWQLDALRAAALAATLECYAGTPQREPALPVLQLLATPLENLRDRAERLAPQLAQAAGVAAADAIPTLSHYSIADSPNRGEPSFGVALTAADGDLHSLEQQLLISSPPVFGRIEEGRLVLDLRTVFPRQDQSLVESITRRKPPSAATA